MEKNPIVVKGEVVESAIFIKNEQESATADPFSVGRLYLTYAVILASATPSWIGFVRLKYQHTNLFASKIHSLFADMAFIAYMIAIAASLALFHLNNTSVKKPFFPTCHTILAAVFYLSGILALVSYMLLMSIPFP